MNELSQLEVFEMEMLFWLQNEGFLKNLIFGGGTMLRLCHNLSRFSVDLDFWLYRVAEVNIFYESLKNNLTQNKDYLVTDTQNKFHTLLFEIKKSPYPRKLKVEIRKEMTKADYQGKIAYSKYSNLQVLVKTFTLEQMMLNKISALLDRREIRDAFDLEFLIRNGIALPEDQAKLRQIKEIIQGFQKRDYFVTLSSLLEPQIRNYYRENGFSYLIQIINQKLSY